MTMCNLHVITHVCNSMQFEHVIFCIFFVAQLVAGVESWAEQALNPNIGCMAGILLLLVMS